MLGVHETGRSVRPEALFLGDETGRSPDPIPTAHGGRQCEARELPGQCLDRPAHSGPEAIVKALASTLPEYQTLLASYHRAFASELRAIVEALPLPAAPRVLDLACGDGTYTAILASRVGTTGHVVGVDLNTAYLELTRETARRAAVSDRTSLVQADIKQLPFPGGGYDLAWCAQSLFSLPDPIEALVELRRVVRPGGVVAVLENDTLHQVLLPWPVEVELAVRAAEFDALVEESDRPRKYYVARSLGVILRSAGLVDCRMRSFVHDRQGPLAGDERNFIAAYLQNLRERVEPRLSPTYRDIFDRLVHPTSPGFLPDLPDSTFTIVDHLVWAHRP